MTNIDSTEENSCFQVIRVIANSSINPEAGSALALSEKVVDSLLRVAAAASNNNDELLLPTLAALNNLSFYSIVRQKQTYLSLKPFLHCSNSQVFDSKRNIWESFINFDNLKEKLIGQTKADVVVQLLVVWKVQFKSAELSSTLSNVYIST